MQSAQLQTLSESPLAAKPQLSEKPRLGFETKKTAGKPGPSVCNFTVTLGLRATVIENGVRKTYSARYYNPNTGRFMSRDPFDGYIDVPVTLHKYLYAGSDPVNRRDPSGRDLEEYEIDVAADETLAKPAEEEAINALEEAVYKLRTLKNYQISSQGPGYRIITQGTEDFTDDLLDDFIKLYNAK
jgi:RHS repeat-associated protein